MLLLAWRSPLKRARRAARSGRWPAAAAAYRTHLDSHSHDGDAWLQLGHSLKEQGELGAAADAYRHAVRLLPDGDDAPIHLAHVEHRLGRRQEALATLVGALGTGGNPSPRIIGELVELGARECLPPAIQVVVEADTGCFARSRYSQYRVAFRAPDPARMTELSGDVLAVIDARALPVTDAADLIAATRATIGDTAIVVLTDDQLDAAALPLALPPFILLARAGTRLEPDAVARLRMAMQATGAPAAYGDHDHWTPAACGKGVVLSDPCFQPMFDPVWFSRAEVRPPMMLVARSAAADTSDWAALFARRLSLRRYAHVPLVLASLRTGLSPCGDTPTDSPSPTLPATARAGGQIQVVIQTRDAPDMLERCVTSLRTTAERPDQLEIIIVDNRSVLPRTFALLHDWAVQGIARVMPHDETFNWARANNLAAGLGHAQHLLFLNNDVEMDSPGWDIALRDGLADRDVGILGALLLYPDRSIQHAGVVFGMGDAGAVHEGVGHAVRDGGPGGRWRYPRFASAVTGAWMATSRELFATVGGFEERLPVGYNDIDFCLRCRAADRQVMQASHIVAVHDESATRGKIMTAAEQARDRADWAWMRARWGDAVHSDPAYNPNWARIGRPFDGLAIPGPRMLEHWTELSARERPWRVPPAQPVTG